MEIVRTALTGTAATTFFSDFLMRDQSALAEVYDRDLCEDMVERESVAETAATAGENEGRQGPFTPCDGHLQER